MIAKAMVDDTIYYAIGGVHGMFDKLVALHGVIAEWHDRAHGQAPQKIIHLGDYVDRGPDSQAVIDHLLNVKPSPGHEMICLMGNHERMMIEALEGELPSQVMWLRNRGRETLQS